MNNKEQQIEAMRELLEERHAKAACRNYGFGRPATVYTLDGIPWTVTGRLADKARRIAAGMA